MITRNRLAQFLSHYTIFTRSRVDYFSLARLETGPIALCQFNFKQVLGIQSVNKRLIKFVINLIFIRRIRCIFTSARVLGTFY